MTSPNPDLITTRSEFQSALRLAFAETAEKGSRELWLCDSDFAAWPLGERAVVEHLGQWAASGRKLVVVARSFDDLARRHPRWVDWRRQSAHIVACRSNAELEAGDIPTVLMAVGVVSVRLADPILYRGRVSREKADEVRCKELVDAVLQRSEEAFPATTTGL